MQSTVSKPYGDDSSLCTFIKIPELVLAEKTSETSIENPVGFLQDSKRHNIERCLGLLDHLSECQGMGKCSEGEGCRRTKQVLFHHLTCSQARLGQSCSICQQFIGLCRLHTKCCQKAPESCDVPLCPNVRAEPRHIQPRELMPMIPSEQECKEVIKGLEIALRKSSTEEKRQGIMQLLKKHPIATSKVLRSLHKKKNNLGKPRNKNQGLTKKMETESSPAGTPQSIHKSFLYRANFKMAF